MMNDGHNTDEIRLNSLALKYLIQIKQLYFQYFSDEQKNLLEKLVDLAGNNELVVAEYDYENFRKIRPDYQGNPSFAHGPKKRMDGKIHFYLTENNYEMAKKSNLNLNELSELVLAHELFHFFIQTTKSIGKGEITEFVEEGLVDMFARNLLIRNGIYNYFSEYGRHVLFAMELTENIDILKIFNLKVEDEEYKEILTSLYDKYKSMQDRFSQIINQLVITPVQKKILVNTCANCVSFDEVKNIIEKFCFENNIDLDGVDFNIYEKSITIPS